MPSSPGISTSEITSQIYAWGGDRFKYVSFQCLLPQNTKLVLKVQIIDLLRAKKISLNLDSFLAKEKWNPYFSLH